MTNVLSWCLWRICWTETILSLKINNIMSGKHIEVKGRKKTLFWPLKLLLGLTQKHLLCKSHYIGSSWGYGELCIYGSPNIQYTQLVI